MEDFLSHFRRLLWFDGRETVGSFWPFAGFVIGLSIAAWLVVFIPEFVDFFARAQKFAAEHPDQVSVTQGPGHYSIEIEGYHPELMPDFDGLMEALAVITAITVCLLAAAVTRRLHDTGKRGWWGLLPLPFLAHGYYRMPGLMDAAEPDFSQFFLLFANNMVYLATLGLLVFLLCRKSQQGPNDWGEQPAK